METAGQRAILFADVCESTAIYEKVGDEPALALMNHLFASLDKVVHAAGGVIVKNMGDGVICEFREPDAAFRAACEMQEASDVVAAQAWPGMKIKIGFNYGPIVLKDGDVFGDTVNVCARVVSLANPAQVLTTQRTIEMLSPGLRTRCRELYTTPVRGRTSQVKVWEVMWRSDPDVTKVEAAEPSEEQGAKWVLKLSIGGESYILQPGATLRIGRDAANDIVVATENASRIHARIFTREDHFVIVDQSSNGTFLMADGSREVRLRRSEALLGDRGWIGLGRTAARHGDHVLRYRLERDA